MTTVSRSVRSSQAKNCSTTGGHRPSDGTEQLAEMQKIIDAETSDLFNVLAPVVYALPPLTREERAAKAKVVISTHFNTKQQAFLDLCSHTM